MNFTVKTLRKVNNFTIMQISKKLGISACKYIFYELMPHRIPAQIAIMLAKIHKISVDDIFFGEKYTKSRVSKGERKNEYR